MLFHQMEKIITEEKSEQRTRKHKAINKKLNEIESIQKSSEKQKKIKN